MTGLLLTRLREVFIPLPQARLPQRYALALVMAVFAVLLRGLLDPVLGHVAFYATVYMSVAFCALVCGLVPAVLTASVGFLGVFYWFVDPRNSLSLSTPAEIHGITGFFLVCTVLVALGDANRKKQLRLNETVVALTKEAHEREHAEEELRQARDLLEQRVEQRTSELSHALMRLESEIEVRKRAEEQLRHLSVRLMTLQDEERRRIARDLHDTAGQMLAALKMVVAAVGRQAIAVPELLPLVEEMNGLLDETLREIRTTSYLLHPPLLDEAGFSSAARWFLEGFAKRSNIEVQCELPETGERWSREYELVLFRVLQESLTNVHRHADASAANIKVTLEDNQVRLEVCDNGRGIEQDRLKRFQEANSTIGVGIAGMRERVRQVGGTLDIRSDKSGTTVIVALPVAENTVECGRGVPA